MRIFTFKKSLHFHLKQKKLYYKTPHSCHTFFKIYHSCMKSITNDHVKAFKKALGEFYFIHEWKLEHQWKAWSLNFLYTVNIFTREH